MGGANASTTAATNPKNISKKYRFIEPAPDLWT